MHVFPTTVVSVLVSRHVSKTRRMSLLGPSTRAPSRRPWTAHLLRPTKPSTAVVRLHPRHDALERDSADGFGTLHLAGQPHSLVIRSYQSQWARIPRKTPEPHPCSAQHPSVGVHSTSSWVVAVSGLRRQLTAGEAAGQRERHGCTARQREQRPASKVRSFLVCQEFQSLVDVHFSPQKAAV
jgi:hypothetical protein